MNRQVKNVLLIIIPLLLGCGIIYYQYQSLSTEALQNIKTSLWKADYFYVALSLLVATLGHWLRAYRWKYALNHLGYYPKTQNSFLTVSVSYLVNLTIPRSGEVTRAVLLKKYEDVPFDKAFGTIVAERIVDLALFFLFVITGFALQFDTLYGFLQEQNIGFQSLLLISVGFLVVMVLFVLIWIYAEWPIIQKLKHKFSGLTEGLLSVYKMEKKWHYIGHSFLIWGCYLVMFYIPIFALEETHAVGFDVIIMGFIFGSLAIGFTNGGIGAYPFSIALIFGLYGIPNETGTAFGWLVWTSQTLLTLFLGLLSYLLLPLLNRK